MKKRLRTTPPTSPDIQLPLLRPDGGGFDHVRSNKIQYVVRLSARRQRHRHRAGHHLHGLVGVVFVTFVLRSPTAASPKLTLRVSAVRGTMRMQEMLKGGSQKLGDLCGAPASASSISSTSALFRQSCHVLMLPRLPGPEVTVCEDASLMEV